MSESNDDQIEYILLDIPSKPDFLFDESQVTILVRSIGSPVVCIPFDFFQNLDSATPGMMIGRKHLLGDIQDVMGTALVFEIQQESVESTEAPAMFGSLPESAKKSSQSRVNVQYFAKTTKRISFK
jgi:hypothetical protein